MKKYMLIASMLLFVIMLALGCSDHKYTVFIHEKRARTNEGWGKGRENGKMLPSGEVLFVTYDESGIPLDSLWIYLK